MPKITTLLFLLAASLRLVAQAPVTPAYGTYEITAKSPVETLIVPIKVEKLEDYQKMLFHGIHPQYVRLLNNTDVLFNDAVSFVKDSKECRLLVTVHTDRLNVQGVYEVSIPYMVTGDPKVLAVNFNINRPASVIEAATPVLVTETWGDIVGDPFVLRETGGRAGINDLLLKGPFVQKLNNCKLVTFSTKPYVIRAGGMLTPVYGVDPLLVKSLPLGMTPGKMYVSSTALSAPVLVQFEFWRKRPKWLIFVVVALGLGAGFLIRYFLKDRKDLEAAKLDGFTVMKQITEESTHIGDPEFKAKAADLINDISLQINGGTDAAAVTKEIEAAKTAYKALTDQLKLDLDTQGNLYRQLSAIPDLATLPDAVKRYLENAVQKLADAKIKLAAKNASGAAADLSAAQDSFTFGFKSFAAYSAGVAALIVQPTFLPAKAGAPIRSDMTARSAAITTALNQLLADVATPKTAVADMVGIQQQLAEVARQLEKSLTDQLTENEPALIKAPVFHTALIAWLQAVVDLAENAGGAALPSANWNQNLTDRLDKAWAAGTILGAAGTTTATLQFASASVNLPVLDTHFGNVGGVLKGINTKISQTRACWYAFSIIQGVLLMLLIGLGIYNVYGPKFVGTCDELIVIFLLSFSVDITVDGVLQFKPKTA